MTYAIVSDIHAHAHSLFSKANPTGVNSRLQDILDEWERAAIALKSAGGRTMICAGDIFHVRGSLDPEVLNPVKDTVQGILGMDIDIIAIPGNHDLKSNDTNRLSSAVEALVQNRTERSGTFSVFNEPGVYNAAEQMFCMVPWRSTTKALLEDIQNQVEEIGDVSDYALVIHAGIDGVVTGMPDHGLTAKILGDFGFKHVFAGHYHNHKVLEHGVVSIGATTHHSWRDVDSKAGFLLVEGDKIQFHATHAPRFIDISGWDEDDIKMEAPGNFIRFRGPPMDAKDLEELRKWLSTLGAKGVQVDVAKVSASARSAASPASGARSLDDSVLAFVDASASVPATIDKAKLKQRAADVLNRARAVEEA